MKNRQAKAPAATTVNESLGKTNGSTAFMADYRSDTLKKRKIRESMNSNHRVVPNSYKIYGGHGPDQKELNTSKYLTTNPKKQGKTAVVQRKDEKDLFPKIKDIIDDALDGIDLKKYRKKTVAKTAKSPKVQYLLMRIMEVFFRERKFYFKWGASEKIKEERRTFGLNGECVPTSELFSHLLNKIHGDGSVKVNPLDYPLHHNIKINNDTEYIDPTYRQFKKGEIAAKFLPLVEALKKTVRIDDKEALKKLDDFPLTPDLEGVFKALKNYKHEDEYKKLKKEYKKKLKKEYKKLKKKPMVLVGEDLTKQKLNENFTTKMIAKTDAVSPLWRSSRWYKWFMDKWWSYTQPDFMKKWEEKTLEELSNSESTMESRNPEEPEMI